MTKRTLWLVLLGCAALWAALSIAHNPRAPQAHATFIASARKALPQLPLARGTAGVAPPGFATQPKRWQTQRAALIDAVRLDKQRVCVNEDVRVSITGTRPAGVDFNVDGAYGNPIVLRAKTPGIQTYHVVATDHESARDYRSFDVTVLPEHSSECDHRLKLWLDAERRPHDVVFAKVTLPADSAAAANYVWDFGDGTNETTATPWVLHSYAERRQDGPISSFIIAAQVVAEHELSGTARASVWFDNVYYEARRVSGNRVLPARAERFPRRAGASYAIDAEVRNLEPHLVHFDTATLKLRNCDDSEHYRVRTLPSASLAGLTPIEPDQTARGVIEIPSAWVPSDVCRATIELQGDTEPPLTGTPMEPRGIAVRPVNATLAFELRASRSAQRPGGVGLAPDFIDKVRKASAVLQRPVTARDIEQLQLEGRL